MTRWPWELLLVLGVQAGLQAWLLGREKKPLDTEDLVCHTAPLNDRREIEP